MGEGWVNDSTAKVLNFQDMRFKAFRAQWFCSLPFASNFIVCSIFQFHVCQYPEIVSMLIFNACCPCGMLFSILELIT
jgi:hypothetical protein